MALTLGDLREFVEMNDHLDSDTEVVMAVQPAWPMEYALSQDIVVVPNDENETDKIYLNESHHNGYLPEDAAREIGWR